MKVEVFFVEGCPNHSLTTERVREALRRRGIDASVSEVEVRSTEQATALRFLGSPTVHINGVDVEPEARNATSFAFGCRTYLDEGVRSGTPALATLDRAIEQSITAPAMNPRSS